MATVAAEEKRKHDYLAELLGTIANRMDPVNYETLGFTDAFFLYAVLIAAGGHWQGRHIKFSPAQPVNFAPTNGMAITIYLRLYEQGVLAPSPCSDPGAFDIADEATKKINFSPLQVSWTLADSAGTVPIDGILRSLERALDRRDHASVAGLWFMVAEAECERYFGELCERYRFSKEAVFTSKVAESIRYCLERVSLPQVWNILWYVMREIAALIQEGRYIRPHVYNMISGNIRRDIDRKLANSFTIRPWSRLRQEKEPIITGILFDKIFGKGNLAFETVNGRNVASLIG